MIDVYLLIKIFIVRVYKDGEKRNFDYICGNMRKVFLYCLFYNIFICSCKCSIRCFV